MLLTIQTPGKYGLSLALAFALFFAACNIGPAMSLQMKCSTQMTGGLEIEGTCQEEIDDLTGEFKRSIVIQTVYLLPKIRLFITGEVSEGSFTILVKDESGQEVTQTARPDRPLDMHIIGRLDALNSMAFTLLPGGAGAKGIQYEVRFECECLP